MWSVLVLSCKTQWFNQYWQVPQFITQGANTKHYERKLNVGYSSTQKVHMPIGDVQQATNVYF
jgi:hypothetical protein